MLCRHGTLACREAVDGAPLTPGCLSVAPAGFHMLLGPDAVLLRHGPLENRFRPAIDPLFRSAAAHHSTRVIGVVLSGHLNDGAAGLAAIKRCGGLAVVQDPDDAEVPEMPESALRASAADHVVPARDLPGLLRALVAQPAPEAFPVPPEIATEAAIAANQGATIATEQALGDPSEFSCPDCGGVLWRMGDDRVPRYRCHTGHAYTEEALAAAQSDDVEYALWSALRALREKSAMLESLARRAEADGREKSAARFRDSAAEYAADAERVLGVLTGREQRTPDLAAE